MIFISVTYTLARMPALPLTSDQLADAVRLKALFERWKAERKSNGLPSGQLALGDLLDMNQSAVSQYLNGGIPLNIPAAAKFATAFGCQIDDFSQSLAKEAKLIGDAAAIKAVAEKPEIQDLTHLSKHELQLVLTCRELSEGSRTALLQFANQLLRNESTAPNQGRAIYGAAAVNKRIAAAPVKSRAPSKHSELQHEQNDRRTSKTTAKQH